MDTQNKDPQINRNKQSGRVYGGIFLLLVGLVFLLHQADFVFFPRWLFSWPVILIAVGIFTGMKHNFRGGGWMIPIIIGGIFLLDRMDIGLDLHRFLVPAIIIAVGLSMILRPRRHERWNNWRRRSRENFYGPSDPISQPQGPGPTPEPTPENSYRTDYTMHPEDMIDVTSVLGNTQRIVVSKNFKGGDVTCFMGGSEIDMTQADIKGTVIMDITAVMGGVKMIVPSNWEIKSEINAVLGGVEDKRQVQGKVIDFNKVLVLKGTAFMGGIELRSF
jgi:predicted membrane protein